MTTDNHTPPLLPEEPPPVPSIPPPLPEQPKDFTSKAKELLGSLASRGKAAGLLIAKQTERTKLVKATLPSRYHALGKHLYAEGQYQDEFPSNFQAIDTLLGQIKAVEARSASGPKAEGIAAKATAAAKATQDMMQAKTLKMKLGHALAELGKVAFEKHGEGSGPEEVIRPIANAVARVENLDAEIARLSQSQAGQILTPKTIAIGGIAVVGLLALVVVANLLGGRAGNGGSKKLEGDSVANSSVIKVQSSGLVTAYENNEVAADERYKGKILEVSGEVGEVKKDMLDTMYVELKGGDGEFDFRGVQCYFDDSHKSSLSNLSKGRWVTIRGQCDGLMGNVQLKECEIVK